MGVWNRIGKWFLTESGKKFVFRSTGAGALAIFCGKILPNTCFVDKYQEIVHFYRNGFPVSLTEPLQTRFNTVLDLLQIPDTDKKLFKPFFVTGFEVFSAGTVYSKYGCIIGIPIMFSYIDDQFNIDTSIIKLRQESIPWDMDDGKLLYKSFFMPENAQIYAIAREIEMDKTPKFLCETLLAVTSYAFAYRAGNYLNNRFNLYAKSRTIRFTLYAMMATFAFINYLLLKDAVQLYYEKEIDEYLKNKNEIFKIGGKEYYEKVLMRNIALRGLLGKEGKSLFTVSGNENYLIRQRHLPLVERKEFFESSSAQMV